MAELKKFVTSNNSAFRSDLMKSFVAKHRGRYTSSSSSAAPCFSSGACPFPSTTSTTTADVTDTADVIDNVTANANIMVRNTNATTTGHIDNRNDKSGLNANRNLNNANRNHTQTPTSNPLSRNVVATTADNFNENNGNNVNCNNISNANAVTVTKSEKAARQGHSKASTPDSTSSASTVSHAANNKNKSVSSVKTTNINSAASNLSENGNSKSTTNMNSPPSSNAANSKKSLSFDFSTNGNNSSSASFSNSTSNMNNPPSLSISASPERPDNQVNACEVKAILEEVKRTLPQPLQVLVKEVSDATVSAHMTTCVNTHKAVTAARQRFMAMKEAGHLPDLSKLSLSAGSMWEKMTDQMMPEIGRAIKFCKMLPGFAELSPEDQMKLIKHGSFEVLMTRFSMLIDHVTDTMLDPSHKMVCPHEVVKAMPMGKFLDGFFHVGAQFNPLGLGDGEIGLFAAILVFSPCRVGLSDVKLIAHVQNLYLQALFDLMKLSHSDPEDKFSRALGLIPMFRRINAEHSKALNHMKMHDPHSFDQQFPPLHKELYTASGDKQ